MRFIPLRIHAVMDYILGVVLLFGPHIFGFVHGHQGAVWSMRFDGAFILALALLTRWDMGLVGLVPPALHVWIDHLLGALLILAPFVLQFSASPPNMWVPHVVFGAMILIQALCTQNEVTGHHLT